VSGRGNPRGPMDVGPDVTLLGHVRRSGMDADPDPNRARGKSFERLCCCCERPGRRGEGNEECVPLGVDFDTSVRGECPTQDLPMLG
jgi:hypothetical protein